MTNIGSESTQSDCKPTDKIDEIRRNKQIFMIASRVKECAAYRPELYYPIVQK